MFLAVDDEAFENVFADELGSMLLGRFGLKVIIVDTEEEVIIQWKS